MYKSRGKIISTFFVREIYKISFDEYLFQFDLCLQNVEVDLKESVNEFLEDFFVVYPSLSEKELKYYAKEGIMPEIHMDSYQFNTLDKVVITSVHKNRVEVHLWVSYKSLFTDAIQPFEYNLILEKQLEKIRLGVGKICKLML